MHKPEICLFPLNDDGTESGREGERERDRDERTISKGSSFPSVKMGWILCYALVGLCIRCGDAAS